MGALTRTFLLGGVALFLASPGLTMPPRLERLEPRGGQQGKAVRLELIGRELSEDTRIISQIPGHITPLTAPREPGAGGRRLLYLVEIKADAPTGVYPVRVLGDQGLSNILLFSVGVFVEVTEGESEAASSEAPFIAAGEHLGLNDSIDRAERIETPVTVNGTLIGPDQDFFRFRAAAGESLVFEAESHRIGSAIDPVLEVFRADGTRLARNDDAPGIGVESRVDVEFPGAGEYAVAIRDAKFSNQDHNYYRLKIGQFDYAEGLFPLGGRRDDPGEVELFGGSFEEPQRVRPEFVELARELNYAYVRIPGKPGALPFRFALSDQPEAVEPEHLTSGTVINGRILEPGEIDSYKMRVQPGQRWNIELRAAALGTSQLHGVLTLYDGAGDRLASTSDIGLRHKLSSADLLEETGADQFLSFVVPDEIHGMRLDVEDIVGRGGRGASYRLKALQGPADFGLTLMTHQVNIPLRGSAVVQVRAERRGYDGPIQLSIPELPDDLIMDGGHIPFHELIGSRKAASLGIFTLTPKPGAQRRRLELEIWGEAVVDGQRIRRRARGPGLAANVRGEKEDYRVSVGYDANAAPWLDVNLAAMIVREQPAALDVTTPRHVRLIQGMKYEELIGWSFQARQPGINPPERIGNQQTPNVRAFVRGQELEAGQTEGRVDAISQVGWGPGKFDSVLNVKAEIGGREETIFAPAITVEVVRPYEIQPAVETTKLETGADGALAVVLKRAEGFESQVEIRAENLPFGVTCDAVTLDNEEKDVRLDCRAEEDTAPGEYEIDLTSSSTVPGGGGKKIPFTLPPFKAKLKVLPAGGLVAVN